MSVTPDGIEPRLLAAEGGEALWFLGALATIKAAAEDTGGRFGAIEFLAPRGNGTPLHVHRREDEVSYVLEGELDVWAGGVAGVATAGSFAFLPRDVPHTYLVRSREARFLVIFEPAGFEDFVRAVGEPADRLEIPPLPAVERIGVEGLIRLSTSFGIETLGPPGIPN